jgi:hypothetical protein
MELIIYLIIKLVQNWINLVIKLIKTNHLLIDYLFKVTIELVLHLKDVIPIVIGNVMPIQFVM